MSHSAPTDLFDRGVMLFNQREYFECHEVLEDYWRQQTTSDKELTQGIIQIAVAFYHLLRDNRVGAHKLLVRGINRIDNFRPTFRDLDMQRFTDEVRVVLQKTCNGSTVTIDELPTLVRYNKHGIV